jgi:ERCC4-type nuclease
LLQTLGSLRAVRSASTDELIAVDGVSSRDAATIRGFFDALAAAGGESGDGNPIPK